MPIHENQVDDKKSGYVTASGPNIIGFGIRAQNRWSQRHSTRFETLESEGRVLVSAEEYGKVKGYCQSYVQAIPASSSIVRPKCRACRQQQRVHRKDPKHKTLGPSIGSVSAGVQTRELL